jgi:hypothetical protein
MVVCSVLNTFSALHERSRELTALNVVTDDPDDDRVIECAVAGNVDAITSRPVKALRFASPRTAG